MTSGRVESEPPAEFEALVARALELREVGRDDWLREACRGVEGLAPRVSEAVAAADGLPRVFRDAYGTDARLGTVVAGRYRILARLGGGAMGVVYEALDLSLERHVALKLLRPGLLDHAQARERFDREARAMAAVGHTSVIAIHDRGVTAEGEAFLVMELVAGRDLGALVEQLLEQVGAPDRVDAVALRRALGFPLATRESYTRVAARWVAELAAGAAVAHAAGVVHRDIKPGNVLVRPDGRAVLLDFGVARLGESAPLTQGGSSVGTPAYMDPLLLGPRATPTPRTDVYGLAAVLYSLLGLHPPFAGAPPAILHALATREPVPLARRNPTLPRDLVAIVERGMARRARERYASAVELERDLLAFLDHRPVVARPIGLLRRTVRRVRGSRVALGVGAAMGVVLITALAGAGRAAWLGLRESRWLELSRHFPPNFTIVDPANRRYVHEPDRAALGALLDRAAATRVDPLPTLLLRASFRLDHGDAAGAAADVRAIARHEGSDFAEALALAYSDADPALDLAALPEPRSARDRYLLAYHHLRAFEDARALELLDEEVRAALPHAEELRFALVDLGRLEPLERQRRALALHADVQRLEERVGVRTAATAHYACYALAHANAYRSSLDVGLEGLALAPRSHVNRTNVGWAAFVLGEHAEAREVLAVANALRPNDSKPVYTIAFSHVAEGDYDRALAVVAQLGRRVERVPAWWAEGLCAEIEAYRALGAWAGEPGTGASPAGAIARARDHLARARELGSGGDAFVSRVLDALEVGDRQQLFETLAGEFAADVRRVWRLAILREHLPDRLEPAPTRALAELLAALEQELAGARSPSPTVR